MAIVINGSGTVTGLSVGGLPDGTVDAGTLATNSVDSAELIDGAVDDSHMAAMAASKLTGALPAISGASLTNLPAQGITDYSVWLLTSSVGLNGSSSFADITANQAESGQPSYSRIGSAMTVSSGVFTFPSTGYWLVTGHFQAGGSQGYARAQLMATTNNSSYAEVMRSQDESGSQSDYGYLQVHGLIDVTDTSNVKVKFQQGGTAGRFDGGTSPPATQFTFARIGDT
jgi:hypothetical protein